MSERLLLGLAVAVIISNMLAIAVNVHAGSWWYVPLNLTAIGAVLWGARRYRAASRDLAAMRARWLAEDAEG